MVTGETGCQNGSAPWSPVTCNSSTSVQNGGSRVLPVLATRGAVGRAGRRLAGADMTAPPGVCGKRAGGVVEA